MPVDISKPYGISAIRLKDLASNPRISNRICLVTKGDIVKGEFDVFLCHNSADKQEVRKVATELAANGLTYWLDEEQLRPGLPWQRTLERAIVDIRAAAVFIGGSGLGPWQEMEQEALLRRLVKDDCPVIPVILPSCQSTPDLPVFLEGMNWVDFRSTTADPLRRLIWGITGRAPGETHSDFPTGPRIKELRLREKLTQAQLADLIAVSPATVSKWETGKQIAPQSQARKICAVLEKEQVQETVCDVVVLLHGIRDRGEWQQMMRRILEENTVNLKVFGCKYGYFDVFRFLAPWDWGKRPRERAERQLRLVKKAFPNARTTVIAHSYGTYLLTRILTDKSDIELWRVILCGSVVDENFQWDKVSHLVGDRNDPEKRKYIINDCGSRDIWPVLGKSAGWGYGAAGVDGFGQICVQDRFHLGGHSLFFDEEFVSTWWKPLVEGRLLANPDGNTSQRKDMPTWLTFFDFVPLRWLIVLLVVFACVALASICYRLMPNSSRRSNVVGSASLDVSDRMFTVVDVLTDEIVARKAVLTYTSDEMPLSNTSISGQLGQIKDPGDIGNIESVEISGFRYRARTRMKLMVERINPLYEQSIRPLDEYDLPSHEIYDLAKQTGRPDEFALTVYNETNSHVDLLFLHYAPVKFQSPFGDAWELVIPPIAPGPKGIRTLNEFNKEVGLFLVFASMNGMRSEHVLTQDFYLHEAPLLIIKFGRNGLSSELLWGEDSRAFLEKRTRDE
ncbi:similar to ymc [Rhodopirellula baltica SH 1]|uniref:Similar to ymc n=1 Tax=Rhodopirellula baltica (strain DSM 10527 / NCIMB 13988 / SH1) TaxID=243090 RepID=Q7UT57_RHOBA|nr:similar to ymc [Rhodopirellula baltica SH 1]